MDTRNVTSEAQGAQAEPVDMIPGPLNPLPGPVDFTKPVRTKLNKKPVQIIAICHKLTKPVIGIISCEFLGDEVNQWTLSGAFQGRNGSSLDLENVPAGEVL